MRFSAYGADIESEFPLAGLPAVSGTPAITVKFKSGCVHKVAAIQRGAEESVSGWRNVTCYGGENPVFRLDGVGEFHLRPQEAGICCTPMPETSMETMRYWLMHFVLPVYLLLDTRFDFFHGSAVDVEREAAAFLADSMGGKSTLAHFFVQQGHALLTDEHLGILQEHRFLAVPSVPFARPYRRHEDLGTPVERFASHPLPLRAVYMLELSEGPARVIPLAGSTAATALARNRQLVLSNSFRNLSKERFTRLAALAASVPISKLCVPRDLSRLSEVYQTVLTHLGELHDSL